MRSLESAVELKIVESAFSVPEYTRKSESFPAYGSAIVLKTYAASGSFSDGFLITSVLSFRLFPRTGEMVAISTGDGRHRMIVSSRFGMPIFLTAEPQVTGIN